MWTGQSLNADVPWRYSAWHDMSSAVQVQSSTDIHSHTKINVLPRYQAHAMVRGKMATENKHKKVDFCTEMEFLFGIGWYFKEPALPCSNLSSGRLTDISLTFSALRFLMASAILSK